MIAIPIDDQSPENALPSCGPGTRSVTAAAPIVEPESVLWPGISTLAWHFKAVYE